jgi:hypothetical protein
MRGRTSVNTAILQKQLDEQQIAEMKNNEMNLWGCTLGAVKQRGHRIGGRLRTNQDRNQLL